MKLAKLFLALVLMASFSVQAEGDPCQDCEMKREVANVLTDVIVVRPVGVAVTLAGGALFIGLSPLTALASIPPPHDAFQKVGAILMGVPYGYTFVRPLGDFCNSCITYPPS